MARGGSSNIFSVNTLADAYALKAVLEQFLGKPRFGNVKKPVYGGEELNEIQMKRQSDNTHRQKTNVRKILKTVKDEVDTLGVKITTIEQLSNLSDNALTKIMKGIGVSKGGLKITDFYNKRGMSELKRLGLGDPKKMNTKDSVLEAINAMAKLTGQATYDLTGSITPDEMKENILKKMSFQKGLDLDVFGLTDSEKTDEYDKLMSTIKGQYGDLGSAVQDEQGLMKIFQNQFEGLFASKFADPAEGGQMLHETFSKFMEELNRDQTDTLQMLLDELGGKSFLMTSDQVDLFKQMIEDVHRTGELDALSIAKLKNVTQNLFTKEATNLRLIEDLVKQEGITITNINRILKYLKMEKRYTEKQMRAQQKQINQVVSDKQEGRESSEETLDATGVRSRLTKVKDFMVHHWQKGWAIKSLIAFMGHQFQQHLSAVQSIAEAQGRYSDSVLKEFKAIRNEYVDIVNVQRGITHSQIATSAQLLGVQYDLYDKMGRSFGEMSALGLEKIMQLERAMGMTSDEAAGLLDTLKSINLKGAEENLDTIEQYLSFADKAGISSKALFADITENSSIYANNLGDASNKLLQLNVQLIRAGLNMKTITDALSGFDTVEGTIEKTVKMSMLAGQQLDLMPIMIAKMQDDIPEATRLLREQIQSIPEMFWNSTDAVFMKKNFAEEMGMTIADLNKLRMGLTQAEKEEERVMSAFNASVDSIYDKVRHLGWHRVLDSLRVNLLNPVSMFFEKNTWFFEGVVHLIENAVKGLGIFARILGGIVKQFKWVFDWMKPDTEMVMRVDGKIEPVEKEEPIKAMASLFLMSAIGGTVLKGFKSVFGATGGKQVSLLTQIRNILATQSGIGGGMGSKMGLPANIGGKLLRGGMGLAIGGAGIYSAYQTGKGGNSMEPLDAFTSMGGVAMVGAQFGGVWGALIGAVIGLGVAEIANRTADLNSRIERIKTGDPSKTPQQARSQARTEQLAINTTNYQHSLGGLAFANIPMLWNYLSNRDYYSEDRKQGDTKKRNELQKSKFERDVESFGVFIKRMEAKGKDPQVEIQKYPVDRKQKPAFEEAYKRHQSGSPSQDVISSFRSTQQAAQTPVVTQTASTPVVVNTPQSKLDLSPDSIRKLAQAIASIKVVTNVNVDKSGRVQSKEDMTVRQFRNVPSLQENLS